MNNFNDKNIESRVSIKVANNAKIRDVNDFCFRAHQQKIDPKTTFEQRVVLIRRNHNKMITATFIRLYLNNNALSVLAPKYPDS